MFESLGSVEANLYEMKLSDNLSIGALGRKPTQDSHLLVYVPGLTESKEYFLPCLKSYFLKDYSAIALDTLGIGDSTKLDPGENDYGIIAQGTILNQVLDSSPCKSLTIVSHSLGEAIVLAALEMQPRQLHSYISLAGGVSGPTLSEGDIKRLISEETLNLLNPMMRSWGFTEKNADLVLVHSIGSFLYYKQQLENVFQKLDCPRYLIRGENDSQCVGIDGFSEKIVVSKGGHNLTRENPKVLIQHMLQLLTR